MLHVLGALASLTSPALLALMEVGASQECSLNTSAAILHCLQLILQKEGSSNRTRNLLSTTASASRRALEKLQDQAEPQDFEDAKRVLESELGQPLEDLFDDFEPMATAAASLAQVRSQIYYHQMPRATAQL